jgi:hypothetical protein
MPPESGDLRAKEAARLAGAVVQGVPCVHVRAHMHAHSHGQRSHLYALQAKKAGWIFPTSSTRAPIDWVPSTTSAAPISRQRAPMAARSTGQCAVRPCTQRNRGPDCEFPDSDLQECPVGPLRADGWGQVRSWSFGGFCCRMVGLGRTEGCSVLPVHLREADDGDRRRRRWDRQRRKDRSRPVVVGRPIHHEQRAAGRLDLVLPDICNHHGPAML